MTPTYHPSVTVEVGLWPMQNAYGDARSINMLCIHRDISFPGASALREVRLDDPHPAQSW